MAESPQPFPKVSVPSDPPVVKEINAWAALGALLLSHVLEFLVSTFAWNALMRDKMTSQEFLAVVGFCLVGPSIAKARGKLTPGALGLALAASSEAMARHHGAVAQAVRTIRDSIT